MGEVMSIQMQTGNTGTPATDPAQVPTNVIETPNGVQFTPKDAQPEPPASPKIETPERPAWLPEKYKSPEEFAAAHKALEQKLGQPKTPATKTAAAKDGEPVNLDVISQEFAEHGAVTEETLASLEKQGIPRKMVSAYIAGQQALVAQQTADLATVVGSQENLSALLTWAGKTLSPEEVAGYNAQIDAGNIPAAKLMLSAFQSKYTEVNGKEPQLVNGSPSKSSSEGGYNSTAEMTADMRNPKYQNDPAFRKMVERRVGLTTAF